jgi:ParB-like chromosome segregation protein Spo0J
MTLAAPILFQEIPLAAVDLEDHTFVVPDGSDLTRLLASMGEVGLLAPPWLRARADGRWQVVAGLKRLKAAAQLDKKDKKSWERLPARTLPASTPESHCLLVGLYDNAFTRGFNLWEQAILARRLLDHWDRATVAGKFLPYLGLPASKAHLERLLRVSALEPPFQELCAQGRLALTAAASLSQWPWADRAAALSFFAGLPFSQSKQEQFLEDVELLARRGNTSPGVILSRKQLRQPLDDPALTPVERAEAVRRLMRGWVNPRLNAALTAFQQALGRLGLKGHPRVRLQPPPAFEGPDFHLEIKFRDPPELQGLLAEIARLSARQEFSDLTRL